MLLVGSSSNNLFRILNQNFIYINKKICDFKIKSIPDEVWFFFILILLNFTFKLCICVFMCIMYMYTICLSISFSTYLTTILPVWTLIGIQNYIFVDVNFAMFSFIEWPKIQTPYTLLSTNNFFSCREAEYLIYMLTIYFVRI